MSEWTDSIKLKGDAPELWAIITSGKSYEENRCFDTVFVFPPSAQGSELQTFWVSPAGREVVALQPLSELFYDNDLVEALRLPWPTSWAHLVSEKMASMLREAGI